MTPWTSDDDSDAEGDVKKRMSKQWTVKPTIEAMKMIAMAGIAVGQR